MINLSDIIILEGFDDKDYGTLIIVKKIAGQYAKEFREKKSDFKKLIIKLKEEDNNYIIESILVSNEEIKSIEENKNLFLSLDKSLKKLKEKIE